MVSNADRGDEKWIVMGCTSSCHMYGEFSPTLYYSPIELQPSSLCSEAYFSLLTCRLQTETGLICSGVIEEMGA